MRTPVILFALASAVLTVLTSVSSAGAHARLKESTPAVGEVPATSPTGVSITFTNDIQKISGTYDIGVTNEAGADVTIGTATINEDDRSVLSVPLQPALAPGRYVVMYRNVSDADGDPFEAGFAFYVDVEPTEDQLAEDALLEPPEAAATPTPSAADATPQRSPTVAASPTTEAGGRSDGGSGPGGTIIFVLVIGAVVGIVGTIIYLAARQRPG